jgi:hypothetical protein
MSGNRTIKKSENPRPAKSATTAATGTPLLEERAGVRGNFMELYF